MAKISLAGFKDPSRRPRYIIWSISAVLVLAAVMVVALGVTSTRWFCAEGCHKVQDDSIIAHSRSSHNKISCMACHMPVNADPVTFILHKAEALGELYLTVTDNFELPLNGTSHVALAMTAKQCTQCHSPENRNVTPSNGILIDHEAHSEINASCTVCHNRVAHREDFELTGKDPKTGTTKKHADFMSMTACFRCHGLEKDAAAPGTCQACHTPDFELEPDSHKKGDFYPKGHAVMAKDMKAAADKAAAESAEGHASEDSDDKHSFLSPEEAYASGGGSGKLPVAKKDVPKVIAAERSHGVSEDHSLGEELPVIDSVFYCSTCHTDQFCNSCHGMAMPHPAAFKEPKNAKDKTGHPAVSKAQAGKCVQCHGKNETTHFCDSCHHGKAVDHEYDKKVAWTTQHPKPVEKSGLKSCTESCHTVKFCEDCHTARKVLPASHEVRNWTKPAKPTVTVYGKKPAEPSAKHSLDAQKSVESCSICHGTGGVNAKFCKSCHKLDMPHPDEFKKQHVSGKKTPAVCSNCHNFKQLCSNCHHIGSSLTKSWIQVHGGSTNKNGAASCVEKCHKKNDCVDCHQRRDVVPASHNAQRFVRDRSSADAKHADLYKKGGEVCTYCHAGNAAELPNSKFCNRCHKVQIPHASGFGLKDESKPPSANNGGTHAEQLKDAKAKLPATCANCHTYSLCDSCHHKGLNKKKTWISQHNTYVKKEGAKGCWADEAGCHQETYCSYCHVRLSR